MRLSLFTIVGLLMACVGTAITILVLPREWIDYITIGGMLFFLSIFMVFNIIRLVNKDKKKKGKDFRIDVAK